MLSLFVLGFKAVWSINLLMFIINTPLDVYFIYLLFI
jgi:hypothetical protein